MTVGGVLLGVVVVLLCQCGRASAGMTAMAVKPSDHQNVLANAVAADDHRAVGAALRCALPGRGAPEVPGPRDPAARNADPKNNSVQ